MSYDLIGLKVDPSDQELVRIYDLAASGNKPAWLKDGNVYSKHPAILFADSKPTSETRQIYFVWGPIMHESDTERPIPGGASYKQSGDQVDILDQDSGVKIGSCKYFYLWKSGNSTPWCMKEYRSSSLEFIDNEFAIYSLCFRSDSYVRAERNMSKAAKDMLKSATSHKPILVPPTPLTRSTRALSKRSALKKKETCNFPVKGSSIETRSDSEEFVLTQVISADEMLTDKESRTTHTSHKPLVEDFRGMELVLWQDQGKERSSDSSDSNGVGVSLGCDFEIKDSGASKGKDGRKGSFVETAIAALKIASDEETFVETVNGGIAVQFGSETFVETVNGGIAVQFGSEGYVLDEGVLENGVDDDATAAETTEGKSATTKVEYVIADKKKSSDEETVVETVNGGPSMSVIVGVLSAWVIVCSIVWKIMFT